MNTTERAECGRLAESINVLLPALEQFNRFAGPDLAGPERPKWRRLLDQPLPERAQGLESVLNDLKEIVIPNGLRIGAPSFAGWITTAPTGADGFNIAYMVTPGTFKDFIDGVVPVLQRRGLMQTDYAEGTFREKLFGRGRARLLDRHPAARYRRG